MNLFMLRSVLVMAVSLSFSIPAGAIPLTGIHPSYTQDFDSIGATGTTPPTGWFVGSLGANTTNSTFTADLLTPNTGSSSTGANYNYGVTGANPDTDRAIGSVASGTGQARVTEARFTNNTGGTIIALHLSYDGEQWRRGASQVANELSLHFSLDGTTFTPLNFDFVSPQVAGAAGALDGNAAANRVAGIGGTFATSIANGQDFYLRWLDLNDDSFDAGIALDNFSLQATNAVPEPTVTVLLGLGGWLAWRRRRTCGRSG